MTVLASGDAAEIRPVHRIRSFDERYNPGGGVINVARMAHERGGDTLALFADYPGGIPGDVGVFLTWA
jgi:6-phosphofructokinase 2